MSFLDSLRSKREPEMGAQMMVSLNDHIQDRLGPCQAWLLTYDDETFVYYHAQPDQKNEAERTVQQYLSKGGRVFYVGTQIEINGRVSDLIDCSNEIIFDKLPVTVRGRSGR